MAISANGVERSIAGRGGEEGMIARYYYVVHSCGGVWWLDLKRETWRRTQHEAEATT